LSTSRKGDPTCRVTRIHQVDRIHKNSMHHKIEEA
jgi:hypothetical protein